jgi:hypothetical protein
LKKVTAIFVVKPFLDEIKKESGLCSI